MKTQRKATAAPTPAAAPTIATPVTVQPTAQQVPELPPVEGVFRGNPTITLDPHIFPEFRRFTFGLDKARKIVRSIDYIRAFVKKHDKQ
jgi:hypothetical protein